MKNIKHLTFLLLAVLFLATAFYLQSFSPAAIVAGTSADGVEAAKTYIAAYNEADDAKRAEMISRSFHEDGIIFTPTRELNKAGLEEMTAEFHEGYFMEIIGEVDSHHNYLSFRWKYSEKNGDDSWSGMDYCEFGEDGRLTKVVIFFDQ